MELFAGSQGLSHARRECGLRFLNPIDVQIDPSHDLSRAATQRLILSLARSGVLTYVHIGVPCTVWSQARRGIKDQRRARAQERLGLDLAVFCASLCGILSRRGRSWSIKHLSSSALWSFSPIGALAGLPHVRSVSWDMCAYGAPHRKPTQLLTNVPELESLSATCSRSHFYRRLQGDATKRAGAYLASLCDKWASCLRGAFGDLCGDDGLKEDNYDFADTLAWVHKRRSRVRRVVGAKPDAPCRDGRGAAGDALRGANAIIRFGQDKRDVPWLSRPLARQALQEDCGARATASRRYSGGARGLPPEVCG